MRQNHASTAIPLTDGDRGRVGATPPQYLFRVCQLHGNVPHGTAVAPRNDECIPCNQLHQAAQADRADAVLRGLLFGAAA